MDPRPIAWIQPGAYAYWVWRCLNEATLVMEITRRVPVQILEAVHYENGADPKVKMRLLQQVAPGSAQETVSHDAPCLEPMAGMEAIAWEAAQDDP